MILRAYSIFDSAVSAYKGFYLFQSDLEAERFATNLLSGEPNDISKYPDSFTLTFVGSFNDSSGFFEAAGNLEPTVKFWELRSRLLANNIQAGEIHESDH